MGPYYVRCIALHPGNRDQYLLTSPETFHFTSHGSFFYKIDVDHQDTTVPKKIAF